MAAPDSLFCATASFSAYATIRHHRKCHSAEDLTDPVPAGQNGEWTDAPLIGL
jgi:hypothetical protein